MREPSTRTFITAAAALAAVGFIAIAPAAQAGDYCVTNISGMRVCPYYTMEQCQASVVGGGGPCYRDPFLPSEAASNALASMPRHVRPHKAAKH